MSSVKPRHRLLPAEEVSQITDAEAESLHYWYFRDLDAGESDDTHHKIENTLASLAMYNAYKKGSPELSKKDGSGALFRAAFNLSLYADYHEFFTATNNLADSLTSEEKREVLPPLSDLLGKARYMHNLFPSELEDEVTLSYGESMANIVFALGAIRNGEEVPSELPLGRSGNGTVDIGKYSFEDAVATVKATNLAMHRILMKTRANQPVERVATNPHKTYNTGIYRFGRYGEVLATVRLLATSKHDSSIEYGNRNGTQAGISYATQEHGGFISEKKSEQKSEFSIRIDNEDNTLSLDIGSILGKKGALGKRIADLIAIGDMYRTKIRGDKQLSLNHNDSKFIYTGLEERELFAMLVSEKAAEFENRAAATELGRLGLGQRAGA